MRRSRIPLLAAGVLLAVSVCWLMTTAETKVAAVRNIAEYRVYRWWTGDAPSAPRGTGELAGFVAGTDGRPLAGARVLASDPAGHAFTADTDASGRYRIAGLPAGVYNPVAGLAGHRSTQLGGLIPSVRMGQGQETADFVLEKELPRTVSPGTDLTIGAAAPVESESPIKSAALRRTVTFAAEGRPSSTILLYTPVTRTGPVPLLIAVYPGPAETWESVSIPLAAAGFAVAAVGPAYALDLTADVDDLDRLAGFARKGRLPEVDGDRIACLGGSYSGLHVLHLIRRPDHGMKAVVLLGAPTDLFDFRRRFETEGFVPPFGLDQALIALGLPNRHPKPYWENSAVHHIRPGMPPAILFHSYQDEIVPWQQSRILAEALQNGGLSAELRLFDGASHYIMDHGEQAQDIYRQTVDFLRMHLEK